MEIFPCLSNRGSSLEVTLCADSSPRTRHHIKVFLPYVEALSQSNCFAPFPPSASLLISALKFTSLKLIQVQLAICGPLQQNQQWYIFLLVSYQILWHNKKSTRFITQNKGQFQSLQDLFQFPSPAFNHKTQRLVFTFKLSSENRRYHSFSRLTALLLTFHRVRTSTANRLKINLKRIKKEINLNSFLVRSPQLPAASGIGDENALC